MRRFLYALLLCAMVLHPIVHGADDPFVCACAHGADVSVAPPELAGTVVTEVAHVFPEPVFVTATVASEIPARAPPAIA